MRLLDRYIENLLPKDDFEKWLSYEIKSKHNRKWHVEEEDDHLLPPYAPFYKQVLQTSIKTERRTMLTFEEFCTNDSKNAVILNPEDPALDAFLAAVDERCIEVAAGQETDPPSRWDHGADRFIVFGFTCHNWFQQGSVSRCRHLDLKYFNPSQIVLPKTINMNIGDIMTLLDK